MRVGGAETTTTTRAKADVKWAERERETMQNINQQCVSLFSSLSLSRSFSLSLYRRRAVFFSIRQKSDDRTNSKGGCNYSLARPMIIVIARIDLSNKLHRWIAGENQFLIVIYLAIETELSDVSLNDRAPPLELICFSIVRKVIYMIRRREVLLGD